jgi:asparagine synthase (glutamine-hydrolysing)
MGEPRGAGPADPPRPDAAGAAALRAKALRRLLGETLEAMPADAILLSGGLDTGVLAALASSLTRRLRAFVVQVAGAPDATELPPPDEPYSTLMARRCGFPLTILRPTLDDLLDRMPEVVRILRTFDPMELRNSVVIHLALDAARGAGCRAVLTGDAADEMLAGYSYMCSMAPDALLAYIRHMSEVMRFSSLPLGAALGLEVRIPYADPRVRDFALGLGAADLVGERRGVRHGKWILRQAFSGWLPEEVVWRVKTPIEYGSRSTTLAARATAAVGAGELESERHRIALDEGVRLRDREHYFYYRIYRRIFPPPRQEKGDGTRCPDCQAPIRRPGSRYCPVCGAFPIAGRRPEPSAAAV